MRSKIAYEHINLWEKKLKYSQPAVTSAQVKNMLTCQHSPPHNPAKTKLNKTIFLNYESLTLQRNAYTIP